MKAYGVATFSKLCYTYTNMGHFSGKALQREKREIVS
jgi:hypothetical protein